MAAATAHWSRRTVLVTGLAVFAAGTAGSALLPSYAAVVASRAVAGLGGAMIVPTAGGVGVLLVPAAQRGRALAVVLAGLTAATVFGSPLGTAMAAGTSWRVTLLAVPGLGLVALLGVAALLPPVPTPPPVGLRTRGRLAGPGRRGLPGRRRPRDRARTRRWDAAGCPHGGGGIGRLGECRAPRGVELCVSCNLQSAAS